MTRRVLPCLVFLALAACASSPGDRTSDWLHPTKDASEWKLDMVECERFFGGSDGDKVRCMATKGWKQKK